MNSRAQRAVGLSEHRRIITDQTPQGSSLNLFEPTALPDSAILARQIIPIKIYMDLTNYLNMVLETILVKKNTNSFLNLFTMPW